MSSIDYIQKFVFDGKDLRGEFVSLEKSYLENNGHHDYPRYVSQLLGEFLLSAVLLSNTIKFEGRLVLQARSEGALPLVMAECSSGQELRGIAHFDVETLSDNFSENFRNGVLAITIEPAKGESYQGIVPLVGENLSDCIQSYFQQSEQLQTKIKFAVSESKLCGFMVQQLPKQLEKDEETRGQQWLEVNYLFDTVTSEELLELDPENLLYRLFHEEQLRLYDKQEVAFHCSCSRGRTDKALVSLGREELESILKEEGEIKVNCEFCNKGYQYDAVAVASLFALPDEPSLQ